MINERKGFKSYLENAGDVREMVRELLNACGRAVKPRSFLQLTKAYSKKKKQPYFKIKKG